MIDQNKKTCDYIFDGERIARLEIYVGEAGSLIFEQHLYDGSSEGILISKEHMGD